MGVHHQSTGHLFGWRALWWAMPSTEQVSVKVMGEPTSENGLGGLVHG